MGSMRRRSILLAAGVAAVSQAWKGAAQTSLGTLTWVEAGSLWIRELPDGRAVKIVSADGLHSPRFIIVGPLACISQSPRQIVGGTKRRGIWRVIGRRGHRLVSAR